MDESNETCAVPEQPRQRRWSMADVPWWAVIVVLIGIYIAYYMLSREMYIQAFKFILPGIKITLQVTVLAYALALVIGLIAGLMPRLQEPYLVRSVHSLRRDSPRPAHAGHPSLRRLCNLAGHPGCHQ